MLGWATPAARDYRSESATDEFNDKRWGHTRGKPLSAEDKKKVADFSATFASLSRPGHAAATHALSPEFWAWVEANGG